MKKSIIELTGGEATVLSCIAAYANEKNASKIFEKLISETTPRARNIAKQLLTGKFSGKYSEVAKRFSDAAKNNLKNALLIEKLRRLK